MLLSFLQTFSVLGDEGKELLRVENSLNGREAAVYLNKVLDAETQRDYQVELALYDGRVSVRRSLLVLVEDVNDNAPVFEPYPQAVLVREHSGPQAVARLKATDRDSGSYGQVVYSLLEEDAPFEVEPTADGAVVLAAVDDLDYEAQSVYELHVLASDRAQPSSGGGPRTATAAVLVRVADEPDRPPVFLRAPTVTRVREDLPPNSEVGKMIFPVRAMKATN